MSTGASRMNNNQKANTQLSGNGSNGKLPHVKGAVSPLDRNKDKDLVNAGGLISRAPTLGQGLISNAADVRTGAERSLERNPSVLSRKELIK